MPPPQYPRRLQQQQQSRSSSVEVLRADMYGGHPHISQPKPLSTASASVTRHPPRAESAATRRSSANPPPDYYESETTTPGNVSRKTRRTVAADEHQLKRLSTADESDRTFTTYSSGHSRRPEKKGPGGEERRGSGGRDSATYRDWNQVDDTYHRPPDFYFMPSQRRWTQVPQNF